MHIIKRNDPCHCGSGKKYKKCCATKGSNDSLQAVLEREVVEVQSELLRHAFSYTEFSNAIQKSSSEFNPPEKMRESFYFFVGIWVLFTSKIFGTKTALEQFCASKALNLRPKVLEIVQSWIGKAPSVVRVVSVNGRNLVVSEIFTKEYKNVKIIDKVTEIPNEGALLFGYIVPFTDDISIFFTSLLSFEDDVAAQVEQFLCKQLVTHAGDGKIAENTSAYLQENFLKLVDLFMSDQELELLESCSEDNNKNEGTDDQETAVVHLLEEKVSSEDMPKSVVEAGSTLWQQYCLKKQPQIKNEKIYAAALHYLLVDKIFPVYRLTQKATAELYDASIGSVSTRSREMACVLEEELKEFSVE